jgi:uncharacterized coiled-coil protein SlyX
MDLLHSQINHLKQEKEELEFKIIDLMTTIEEQRDTIRDLSQKLTDSQAELFYKDKHISKNISQSLPLLTNDQNDTNVSATSINTTKPDIIPELNILSTPDKYKITLLSSRVDENSKAGCTNIIAIQDSNNIELWRIKKSYIQFYELEKTLKTTHLKKLTSKNLFMTISPVKAHKRMVFTLTFIADCIARFLVKD